MPDQPIKATILLVEDEPGFRSFIQRRLASAGHEVVSVNSGQEAVEALQQSGKLFNLVLLDYMLPDTNAQEWIAREWESVGSPAFMVMTGFGDERLAVELMKMGADDYIIKDADLPNLLLPAVDRVLRHVQQRRQLAEAEQKLKESQERLNLALHSSRIAVWDIDVTTGLVHFDDRWQVINGTQYAEFQAPLSELQEDIHPADREYYLRRWRTFLEKTSGSFNFESTFRIQSLDGPMIWVEQQGVVVKRDAEGNPARVICTLHDVTDRMRLREMEEQLVRAQRLDTLGTLAGGIAHDFNNILAAINGYNELMKRDPGNRDVVENATRQIERASQRAKDIVHQVLLFSRREEPEIRKVDLVKIVAESIGFVRAVISAGVVIEEAMELGEAWVDADESQISQVMTNLLTNAAQAVSPENGVIHVRMHRLEAKPDAAAQFCIEVEDNGPGIPIDIQERIFEPFFSTKKKGEGTGLGLATSRGIVESHGGRIILTSEQGRGACFAVILPAVRDGSQTPFPAERKQTIEPAALHILLVDDEMALAEVTTELLSLHGFDVDAYHDPIQALEYCGSTRENYDLAILDYSMPRLNGLALIEKLREIHPHLRCLMVTGNLDHTREEILACPNTSLLHKPYSHEELLESITKITHTSTPRPSGQA